MYLLRDILLDVILGDLGTIWSHDECHRNLSCSLVLHPKISIPSFVSSWVTNRMHACWWVWTVGIFKETINDDDVVMKKLTRRQQHQRYWDEQSTWLQAQQVQPGTPCTWSALWVYPQWKAHRHHRCIRCHPCAAILVCLWFFLWPLDRSDNLNPIIYENNYQFIVTNI